MSPHFRSLHWLPVKQRIQFKCPLSSSSSRLDSRKNQFACPTIRSLHTVCCLLIFKVLKFGLPPYFSPYFVPYSCEITTRRSARSKNILVHDLIPFGRNTYKSKSRYDYSFTTRAHQNSLP